MTTETMSLSEIRRRYREGTPVGVLADLNDCAVSDIRQVIKGTQVSKPKTTKPDKPKVDRSQWREWHSQGMTDAEIAKKSLCSPRLVSTWRYKEELPLNPSEKPIRHTTWFSDPTKKTPPKPTPTEPLDIPQVLNVTREEKPMEEKKKRRATIKRRDVERLVAEGLSSSEIADEIGVTYSAVWAARKRFGLLEEKQPASRPEKPAEAEPVTVVASAPTAPPTRADWQRYRRAQLAEWIQHCAGKGLVIDSEFVAEWNEGVG